MQIRVGLLVIIKHVVTRDLHRTSNTKVGTTEGKSKRRSNQVSRNHFTNKISTHISRSSEIRHNHSPVGAREERDGV